jgi:hypothetical protein
MESDKRKEKPVDSRKFIFCIPASSLMVFLAPCLTSAYEGDGIAETGENKAEDLRRAAQNPVADLIRFPTQKPIVNYDVFYE